MKTTQIDEALIESLARSQLLAVYLDSKALSLRFQFTFGPPADDIVVELLNTAHIVISKDIDDAELLAVVGEVRLTAVSDGGFSILTKLGYLFKSEANSNAVFTYPSRTMYHFHMEGDVSADVVCGKYTITRLKQP
jgi:hypothetical protein